MCDQYVCVINIEKERKREREREREHESVCQRVEQKGECSM